MVQPKYNPEETLQRIKLMMEYDSSKTLDENKKVISEQKNQINEAPLPPAAAGLSSFIPGGLGAAKAAAVAAAPWVLPAVAVSGLAYWLYDSVNNGMPTAAKVESFFNSCSSQSKKLKQVASEAEIISAAESINTAIEGLQTDEDAIKSAFESMKNVADLCALKTKYDSRFGSLYEDLDGDIDGTDWKKYVWAPMQTIIEKSASEINPDDDSKKRKGGTGGYKPCTGTYQKGCKSDIIAKVQGCLGLVTDGKFGPKTQVALSGKGFTTFTDADVTKICDKNTTVVDTDIEDVDGENPNEI